MQPKKVKLAESSQSYTTNERNKVKNDNYCTLNSLDDLQNFYKKLELKMNRKKNIIEIIGLLDSYKYMNEDFCELDIF